MMSEKDGVSQFVRDALNKGQSPSRIHAALAAAGWSAAEIDAALAEWQFDPEIGAVPRPVRSASAWDALFYLVLFVAFWMVMGNVLALLFGQIEIWFPDPDDAPRVHMLSGQRWSMAALLVFVPVYFWLNRMDAKACAADPARRFGAVRRWLASLAMFIAAVTVLGDVLYLIYRFLDGEITAKFLIKSAAVACIAICVFGYFYQDRRETIDLRTTFWGSVPVLSALLVIGLAFATIGGPVQGRIERRDQMRIADMAQLRGDIARCAAVDLENLPEVLDPMACARNPDQLTGFAAAIRYERLSADRYRLCTELEDSSRVYRSSGSTLDGGTYCLD